MATLIENVTRVTNALKSIKQAIINKGVTPSGKCETFADAIQNIPTGVDTSKDTVTPATLLYNITAHDKDGNAIKGNMDTYYESDHFYIPYADTRLVIPTARKYNWDDITVELSLDAQGKLRPYNIRGGVEILGVTGSYGGEISFGTFELTDSNVSEYIDIDTGFDEISDFVAYVHWDATASGKNRATSAIFWDSDTSGREWGCRGMIDTSNSNTGATMVQPINTRVTYFVTIVSVTGGIVRLQMPANATRTRGTYKWFARAQS